HVRGRRRCQRQSIRSNQHPLPGRRGFIVDSGEAFRRPLAMTGLLSRAAALAFSMTADLVADDAADDAAAYGTADVTRSRGDRCRADACAGPCVSLASRP